MKRRFLVASAAGLALPAWPQGRYPGKPVTLVVPTAPADIVQQLNGEVGKVLASADVRKRADEAGTDVDTMTPAQLGAFTKAELERWGQVINGAHITLD